MPAAPIAPLLPDSEDEASQQRHKKKLKDEMKRVSPNRQIVRELMKRTFPVRRREVFDGIGTVQEILSYYPALKSPEEVSRRAYSLLFILNTRLQLIREFNRIMAMETDLVGIWDRMVPKVLDLARDEDVTGLQRFLNAYTHDEVSDSKLLSSPLLKSAIFT